MQRRKVMVGKGRTFTQAEVRAAARQKRKMKFTGPAKTLKTVRFEQADRLIWRELVEMSLDFGQVDQIAKKRNWSQQRAAGYMAGQQAAAQGNRFAGLGQSEWRATDDFAVGYREGFKDAEYSANLPALRA